jgi:hypothetical protein
MATWLLFCVQIKIPNVQNQKTKKESRLEEEIEVSDNWSGFIVLKSSEGGIPLTKLSPFVITKCIKRCGGEVKNVTKIK